MFLNVCFAITCILSLVVLVVRAAKTIRTPYISLVAVVSGFIGFPVLGCFIPEPIANCLFSIWEGAFGISLWLSTGAFLLWVRGVEYREGS